MDGFFNISGKKFDFHLFLPDDETEITLRVSALSHWCQGFLAGYAFAVAEPGADTLPEAVSEVLRDVSAIAQAEVDLGEDDESSEQDFFELTEYLRFGTLNLFLDALSEKLDEGAGEE